MTIEKTHYSHYGACLRLSNGVVEVFVTTDLGPRVICYRFIDGVNILAELGSEAVQKTELGEWHPWGGHRLWHAPESSPRSYAPDNSPVQAQLLGSDSVRVVQDAEPATQIQKEMRIALDPESTRVTLTHKLTNSGLWPVELAPWALTIVNGGGTTILPQEPFSSHGESLLPVRPLALWGYTDLSDPRWTFGRKFICLSTDENRDTAQKMGAGNKRGWAAYLREGTLFVKRFPYVEGATYPDYGCNFETYTKGTFMEVETLGPLTLLQPGAEVTHVETWFLFGGVDAGDTEEELEAAVLPLVKEAQVD